MTDQIASQPGKLCLYVIRQDLPALPRGPGDAHADRAYTVESNDESGIDSTMPVWPKNCLYTGVIVRANIEMPTQAPGATGATPVQLSDQPTQLFSDSMLAASQASSQVGATNDISPKAAREQAYASVDESTSPPAPDPHGLGSSNPTSQTAPSQQFLQTPEVQLINSAVTPICPPIGSAIAPLGASMVVAGQAMSLDVAAQSAGVESTGNQANATQSSGVLSDHAQPGGDPPETPSKLAGARFQDKKVPVAHSSKNRKDLANTATATASYGFENPGQNAVPNTVPSGVQNSLPDADLSVLSDSTSNAVQSVAAEASSNTVSNAGQNAVPNAVLNAPPITNRDATSNAVQSTNSNEAMNGMRDSFAKAFIGAFSNTRLNAASNVAPSAIESAAPSAVTGEMQDSFPIASLNGLSGAGPSDHSKSAPDSAFDGMQDSLPQAYRQALSSAAQDGSSNSLPKAVQSAAPNASPNGKQYSLPSADLSVRLDSGSNAVQSAAANPVPNEMPESLSKAYPQAPSSAAPGTSSEAASNAVQSAAPNPIPNGMQQTLPSAELNGLSIATPDGSSNAAPNAVGSADLNAFPSGMQDSLPNADLSGLSNAAPNTVQSVATNPVPGGMQDSLPNAGFSGLSSAAPNSPSNGIPNAFESTAQNAAHNWLRQSFLEAVLKAFAKAGPNAVSNAAPSSPARIVPNNGLETVPGTVHNVVPSQVQNADPDAVANPASGARLSAEQLQVPQAVPAASAKEVVAAAPGSVPADLAIPPATSPDQTLLANSLSVPTATVDPIASPAQFSSRSLVEGQTGLSGVNPVSVAKPSEISATNDKDGIKGASDDATSTKLHASSESNQSKLQRDNQETTPSGDQGQNSSASQGQNTVRPEMNFANHTVAVVASAQAMVNTSPAQNSAIPAGATAHTAKTPEIATPAPTAVPQALPVINTAKLIQSMGQSEMRVGMRSTEFGNISISTSSTRDLISAQISLDHGELARTLTAHLPEIQARLGGNQPMDVRIEMNGSSAGQTGTEGGMYNGSADQSRGGRPQAGNADSSSSGNRFSGQQLSPVASSAATSDGRFNARLDIRV